MGIGRKDERVVNSFRTRKIDNEAGKVRSNSNDEGKRTQTPLLELDAAKIDK